MDIREYGYTRIWIYENMDIREYGYEIMGDETLNLISINIDLSFPG